MFSTVFLIVGLLVGAFGIPNPELLVNSYPAQQSSLYESVLPPKYDYNWYVLDAYSGNDFGQRETRDDQFTHGTYYVNLPDGRRQTVNYYVNGNSGYVADVHYVGEARYPEPQQYRPQPSYPS